jgi:hypothetical protein
MGRDLARLSTSGARPGEQAAGLPERRQAVCGRGTLALFDVYLLSMLTGTSGVETLLFRELTSSKERANQYTIDFDVPIHQITKNISIVEVPDLFIYREYPWFYQYLASLPIQHTGSCRLIPRKKKNYSPRPCHIYTLLPTNTSESLASSPHEPHRHLTLAQLDRHDRAHAGPHQLPGPLISQSPDLLLPRIAQILLCLAIL